MAIVSSSKIPWLNSLIQKIEGLDFPAEWKPEIQALNDIMISMIEKAGQAYLAYIGGLVVGVANNTTMSGEEKMKYVIQKATGPAIAQPLEKLATSEVNTLLNYTVSKFKASGLIT